MWTDLLDRLENWIDGLAIRTRVDVSLMRRGLYPMFGPYHVNLKQPGLNYLEKDLLPDVIHKAYDESMEMIYSVNTLDKFIPHDNLYIKDFEKLNMRAKRDDAIFRKFSGHESAITYSTEEFYNNKDFNISFHINKALGEEHAKPFMTKLILLEQRLLGLREYLEENRRNKCMNCYAHNLMGYAINHERLNMMNDKIRKIDKKLGRRLFHKKNSIKKKGLEKEKAKIMEVEGTGAEQDLINGQLAAYFLSDKDNIEIRNIKKWVDTHVEYETYRTLFSYGMRLDLTNHDASKKYIDMALEYATYSRPNCGFMERIYTNKRKVYNELLAEAIEGRVIVSRGDKRKRDHELFIAERRSEHISFEKFEKNYLQDLKKLGVDIAKHGDSYALDFGEELLKISSPMAAINRNPDVKHFSEINEDDMIVGSRTNTMSLYGSAFFNAVLGTAIGLLRTVPFLRNIGRYIRPKVAEIGDESKIVRFSPWRDLNDIYKFNKDVFTGKFYRHDTLDLIAENLANRTVQEKTHFSSYYTLKEVSEGHTLESLIQTNNETEFFKNTLVTIGLIFAAEQCLVDPGDVKTFMQHLPWFPLMFGLTWATFSGAFDKPITGVVNVAKYFYNKRDPLTKAIGNMYSPLE